MTSSVIPSAGDVSSRRVEDDHGQYDDTREIFWASGSCMAVRASAFDQCDGL
ncbi:MAG: hypothetical protein MZV63_35525 [Marinilabiliales bacterium]|nr:hypothetical protein [Marinilabiliales bacterium]